MPIDAPHNPYIFPNSQQISPHQPYSQWKPHTIPAVRRIPSKSQCHPHLATFAAPRSVLTAATRTQDCYNLSSLSSNLGWCKRLQVCSPVQFVCLPTFPTLEEFEKICFADNKIYMWIIFSRFIIQYDPINFKIQWQLRMTNMTSRSLHENSC